MKKIVVLTMLVLLTTAVFGQRPARISTDTLPCVTRQPNYYYSYWYDTTWWYLNPTSRDTFYVCDIPGLDIDTFWNLWGPNRVDFTQASRADEGTYVWTFEQYAPRPIRIKGIWGMVSQYAGGEPENPHSTLNYWPIFDSTRLPEYFYLYVRDPKVPLPLNNETTFLERIATVRWDTAQPKMMCLPKTQDPKFAGANGYCHVYEALFDTAITLEGEFWLGGSANSSSWTISGSGPYGHQHFPTVYVCFGQEYGCCMHVVISLGPDGPWGGYRVNNRFGGFGVIIDGQRYVEVVSSDTAQGQGLYTSYYLDSSYQTITAVPNRGFRFSHWSDGVTDNPRTIFVTQDTVFTAYFEPIPQYDVNVQSNDDGLGYVTGDSTYYEGDEAVIEAVAHVGNHFKMWNDSVTVNPRRIVVMQDTAFTAIFGSGPVGVQEAVPSNRLFRLMPNPASNEVRCKTAEGFGGGTLTVVDAAGREVLRKVLARGTESYTFDVADYPAGAYFVTLSTPEGTSTQRLVVE